MIEEEEEEEGLRVERIYIYIFAEREREVRWGRRIVAVCRCERIQSDNVGGSEVLETSNGLDLKGPQKHAQ